MSLFPIEVEERKYNLCKSPQDSAVNHMIVQCHIFYTYLFNYYFFPSSLYFNTPVVRSTCLFPLLPPFATSTLRSLFILKSGNTNQAFLARVGFVENCQNSNKRNISYCKSPQDSAVNHILALLLWYINHTIQVQGKHSKFPKHARSYARTFEDS
jgi:hypothetical protein